MKMTMADFLQQSEAYMGYCRCCDGVTRDCTEPDADGYDCPECEGKEVMGLEDAQMAGFVVIEDEHE